MNDVYTIRHIPYTVCTLYTNISIPSRKGHTALLQCVTAQLRRGDWVAISNATADLLLIHVYSKPWLHCRLLIISLLETIQHSLVSTKAPELDRHDVHLRDEQLQPKPRGLEAPTTGDPSKVRRSRDPADGSFSALQRSPII